MCPSLLRDKYKLLNILCWHCAVKACVPCCCKPLWDANYESLNLPKDIQSPDLHFHLHLWLTGNEKRWSNGPRPYSNLIFQQNPNTCQYNHSEFKIHGTYAVWCQNWPFLPAEYDTRPKCPQSQCGNQWSSPAHSWDSTWKVEMKNGKYVANLKKKFYIIEKSLMV